MFGHDVWSEPGLISLGEFIAERSELKHRDEIAQIGLFFDPLNLIENGLVGAQSLTKGSGKPLEQFPPFMRTKTV